jgi:hypothetical protein
MGKRLFFGYNRHTPLANPLLHLTALAKLNVSERAMLCGSGHCPFFLFLPGFCHKTSTEFKNNFTLCDENWENSSYI